MWDSKNSKATVEIFTERQDVWALVWRMSPSLKLMPIIKLEIKHCKIKLLDSNLFECIHVNKNNRYVDIVAFPLAFVQNLCFNCQHTNVPKQQEKKTNH